MPKARRQWIDYLVSALFKRESGSFFETTEPYFRGSQRAIEERMERTNYTKSTKETKKKKEAAQDKMRRKTVTKPDGKVGVGVDE